MSQDPVTNEFMFNGAQASFTGNTNNFLFIDYAFSNGFYLVTSSRTALLVTSQTAQYDFHSVDVESQWSMQGVSPVPEPESCAMMLTGMGLMGAIVRRRKSKQA